MLLSTSSSETPATAARRGTRGVAVLLSIVAVMLVGLELFARAAVEHGSKVQRMVNEEYAEAIQLRPGTANRPKQLLVVGNSLVGQGVDLDELRRDLPSDWRAHRFWIYNTGYEDWYFGLRRLFGDGSRPDYVAIVFAAMHWYAPGIRGDYSAQYLFRPQDLREMQSHLDLTGTATSSFLFAHYSKFFALRGEIRKVVLEKLMPDLPQMNALFKPGTPKHLSEAQIVSIVGPRMWAYRNLAAKYGVHLVFIVPPIRDADQEHHAAIREAAAEAGVPVVIPNSSRDVPRGEFADEIHLNDAGAHRFTASLASELTPILNK